MRKELELMETIENYLKGNMPEADKTAFEKRINTDPALKKEVEFQRQLMKGIERAGLKQSAKQGLKKYKFNKNLKNWGLTGLTIAVIVLSSVFVYNAVTNKSQKENAANELPELNEQGEKLWSDADKYLQLQSFELDADKDTVVETTDGIVIAIPAHSFLDASGQPAKGNIKLEVKEALNAADIMKAGLTTKSGDKLLETGGMFYINARQDGASLKIDPKNPLYAEVPTDEVKPGMQLFEGKRLANGTIDWVNPKPIQKDLIPVDILSLNFYPPNYLDSLKSWGYNTKDKNFTDSLYYSFASIFGGSSPNHSLSAQLGEAKKDTSINDTLAKPVSVTRLMPAIEGEAMFALNCATCHSLGQNTITGPGMQGIMTRIPSEEWFIKYVKNNDALAKSGDPYAIKINQFDVSAMPLFTNLSDEVIKSIISFIKKNDPSIFISKDSQRDVFQGINPAKIKAIWNENFNNTLLATREFEERLQYIHNSCNPAILNLYVNNLDKDMYLIDSVAGTWETNQHLKFREFAARRDGKVKNGNTNVRILKAYYEQKTKLYTEAISTTVNEFRNSQLKKDIEAGNKRGEHANNERIRTAENFQQELNLNLDKAFQQLGMKRPASVSAGTFASQGGAIPPAAYGVPVVSTGWCNIDRYTFAATMARTTIDYIDNSSGKKAIIKYEPLTVSISDQKNYDRVLVYLLPEELSSFMRIENKNEVFEEKLNQLMTYKMICIAYKGEESFYFSQDNVKPGVLNVSLVKTTNGEIKSNVNKLSKRSHSKAMNDELDYFAFEKEEAKRQADLIKINELTNKVRPVVLPCAEPAAPASDTTSWNYY